MIDEKIIINNLRQESLDMIDRHALGLAEDYIKTIKTYFELGFDAGLNAKAAADLQIRQEFLKDIILKAEIK